ncbi:hypothetical protein [Hymenobacter jejuensis]|uniref:Uncharacterized protein n=1 Tax=Hymenobacter jejuensis TaxID=2502781 RepID=A0A5B7ZYW9_9BACT|nr:hypothetical protein [Hymenobacter jejuensis]QDA59643.1 hypothetical protein FHG12_05765 [Hymenobacter jejuensis]
MDKKEKDLANDKTSVNPAANTKKKSTQVQNPNQSNVSQHGNTTDGNSRGKDPGKTTPIRNNPQGNRPMSQDV